MDNRNNDSNLVLSPSGNSSNQDTSSRALRSKSQNEARLSSVLLSRSTNQNGTFVLSPRSAFTTTGVKKSPKQSRTLPSPDKTVSQTSANTNNGAQMKDNKANSEMDKNQNRIFSPKEKSSARTPKSSVLSPRDKNTPSNRDVSSASRLFSPKDRISGTRSASASLTSKSQNAGHALDEMRAHIARLKAELDAEKARARQVHRDKVAEMKNLKDSCSREKDIALEALTARLDAQKQQEVTRVRETCHRERDAEVRQLLKARDEDLKQIKAQIAEEKEEAVRAALEMQKRALIEQQQGANPSPGRGSGAAHNSALVIKLQREMRQLKERSTELEEQLRVRTEAENERSAELRRIQAEHELEVKRLLKEGRKEAVRGAQQLKKAEEALNSKNKEISSKESLVERLHSDKLFLSQQLRSLSGSQPNSATSSLDGNQPASPKQLDSTVGDSQLGPDICTGSGVTSRDTSVCVESEVAPSLPADETSVADDLNDSALRSSTPVQEHKRLHDEKETKEREKGVQRKVTDLNATVSRLEKRLALLKSENEALKKKGEDQKPAEEKIKKLKKRNAELAAIARRLEEKAKQLQESSKRRESALSPNTSTHTVDADTSITSSKRRGSQRTSSARQAEEAKAAARERVLESMRERCQQLTNQLIAAERANDVTGSERLESRDELENLMRKEAAERLRLETRVAQLSQQQSAEETRSRSLAENNRALRTELDRLVKAAQDTEKLVIEVTQRKIECEALTKDLTAARQRVADSDRELQETVERNTQLSVHNSDLQQRIDALDKVNAECTELRQKVAEADKESSSAKQQASSLSKEVDALQTEVKKLRGDAEKAKELEKKQRETQRKLKIRDQEVRQLKDEQRTMATEHAGAMSDVTAKLAVLERRYEEQHLQHEHLSAEMSRLQAEAARRPPRPTETVEAQTEQSIWRLSGVGTEGEVERHIHQQQQQHNAKFNLQKVQNAHDDVNIDDIRLTSGDLDTSDLVRANENQHSQPEEYDNYDNNVREDSTQPNLHSDITESHEIQEQHGGNQIQDGADEIQDGRHEVQADDIEEVEILEELHDAEEVEEALEAELSQNSSSAQLGYPGNNHTTNANVLSGQFYACSSPRDPDLVRAFRDDLELSDLAKKICALSADSDGEGEGENNKVLNRSHDLMPAAITASAHLKNTPFQVFIARYSYDPMEYSPNENPESELNLNAGDYIFVYGDMDEDGFLEGELMDGRRGLVPSNFVEKVPDEELEEFQAHLRSDDVSDSLDFNSSDENPEKFAVMQLKKKSGLLDQADLEEVPEEGQVQGQPRSPAVLDNASSIKATEVPYTGVPPPCNLRVERQLHNSVLIAWDSPPSLPTAQVNSYHVMLDGQFRTSVSGTERTKALLEGLDLSKPQQLSLRTITNRGHSSDALQVITIGNDASLAPSQLEVTQVTSTSACVSWLPSSSTHAHTVTVNAQNLILAPPCTYKYSLTGLEPASQYKVMVTTQVDEATIAVHKAANTTFKTLEAGIPDAPLDIQVEVGPREGTLLVTWLPVTITTTGQSNGALVTGYSVYVDGTRVQQVNSPTGDHVALEGRDFDLVTSPPQRITVRTRAQDSVESPDSLATELTSQHVTEVQRNRPGGGSRREDTEVKAETQSENEAVPTTQRNQSEALLQTAEPIITPAPSKKPTNESAARPLEEELAVAEGKQLPEGTDMVDDSELSDIQEVSEEEVNQRSPGSTPKTQPRSGHKRTSPAQHNVSPQRGKNTNDVTNAMTSPGQQVYAQQTRLHTQGVEQSPRLVPTRIVSDGHVSAPHVAFRPVRHDDVSSPSPARDLSPKHRDALISPRDYSSNQSQYSSHHGDTAQPIRPQPVRAQPNAQLPHIQVTRETDPHRAQSGPQPDDSQPRSGKSPSGSFRSAHAHQGSAPGSRQGSTPGSRQGSAGSREGQGSVTGSARAGSAGALDDSFGTATSYTETQQVAEGAPQATRVIRDDLTMSELIDYEDDGGESLVDSVAEVGDVYDQSRVRIFIALFDYNPQTMSPNPDGADEELTFREGQLIKIFGEKDADGFFAGEAQGRRGLVPCNMVSEVQVDDPEIADQLLKESNRSVSSVRVSSRGTSRNDSRGPPSRGPPHPHHNGPTARSPRRRSRENSPGNGGGIPYPPASGPRRRMRAMYDYDPTQLSPNVDVEIELGFRAGQTVLVFGEMDEDGFFYGEINGRRGLVPSNFLTPDPDPRDLQGDPRSDLHGELRCDPRDPRADIRGDPRVDPRVDPRFDPRDLRAHPREPRSGSTTQRSGSATGHDPRAGSASSQPRAGSAGHDPSVGHDPMRHNQNYDPRHPPARTDRHPKGAPEGQGSYPRGASPYGRDPRSNGYRGGAEERGGSPLRTAHSPHNGAPHPSRHSPSYDPHRDLRRPRSREHTAVIAAATERQGSDPSQQPPRDPRHGSPHQQHPRPNSLDRRDPQGAGSNRSGGLPPRGGPPAATDAPLNERGGVGPDWRGEGGVERVRSAEGGGMRGPAPAKNTTGNSSAGNPRGRRA